MKDLLNRRIFAKLLGLGPLAVAGVAQSAEAAARMGIPGIGVPVAFGSLGDDSVCVQTVGGRGAGHALMPLLETAERKRSRRRDRRVGPFDIDVAQHRSWSLSFRQHVQQKREDEDMNIIERLRRQIWGSNG